MGMGMLKVMRAMRAVGGAIVCALFIAACGSSSGGVAASVVDESPTAPEAPASTSPPAESRDRRPLPLGVNVRPGPYEAGEGDVIVWFDIPDLGDDMEIQSPLKTEWQVTWILTGPRAGLPQPGFGIAWAEPGATVGSVVEALRESDNGRHSFDTSSGLFQGIETTVVTRTSLLEPPVTDRVIELATGETSSLMHLYTDNWTMESHVFERDGRVLLVNYEWAPGQREMVLAEAASVVASIELRSAS